MRQFSSIAVHFARLVCVLAGLALAGRPGSGQSFPASLVSISGREGQHRQRHPRERKRPKI